MRNHIDHQKHDPEQTYISDMVDKDLVDNLLDKLSDKQRINYLKKNRKNLTKNKMDLIVDTMFENEKWQKKIPDYPYKDASLEKIKKWLLEI